MDDSSRNGSYRSATESKWNNFNLIFGTHYFGALFTTAFDVPFILKSSYMTRR
jgi:hypothetical protein